MYHTLGFIFDSIQKYVCGGLLQATMTHATRSRRIICPFLIFSNDSTALLVSLSLMLLSLSAKTMELLIVPSFSAAGRTTSRKYVAPQVRATRTIPPVSIDPHRTYVQQIVQLQAKLCSLPFHMPPRLHRPVIGKHSSQNSFLVPSLSWPQSRRASNRQSMHSTPRKNPQKNSNPNIATPSP